MSWYVFGCLQTEEFIFFCPYPLLAKPLAEEDWTGHVIDLLIPNEYHLKPCAKLRAERERETGSLAAAAVGALRLQTGLCLELNLVGRHLFISQTEENKSLQIKIKQDKIKQVLSERLSFESVK